MLIRQKKIHSQYFLLTWLLLVMLTYYNGKSYANLMRNDTQPIIFNKNDYYIAAVIDYTQIIKENLQQMGLLNLYRYLDVIDECGKYAVDIVVFPECGLYSCLIKDRKTVLEVAIRIPSSEQSIIPCHNEIFSHPEQIILETLSCSARKNHIYVVVNLFEQFCQNGTVCSDQNILLYNTEVVFDRKGMIIAKYRKFNLYESELWFMGLNRTEEVEIVSFDTDFGVKFGVMICYDILFKNPGITLVEQYNITHMIYSAQMVNRLPFLTPSSVEAGWSYALDVTLIASSLPTPIGFHGSNIVLGKEQGFRTYMTYINSTKIILAPVPKQRYSPIPVYPKNFLNLKKYEGDEKRKEYVFLKEHVMDKVTKQSLYWQTKKSVNTFNYKSNTFECNINVSWKSISVTKNLPNYQFLAYSGLDNHTTASVDEYEEMCGLTLCALSKSSNACLLPPQFQDSSDIVFTSINISAKSVILNTHRIPIITNSDMMALNTSYFKFYDTVDNETGTPVRITNMTLLNPASKLISFGVYKLLDTSNPILNFNWLDFILNEDIIVG